MTRGLTIVALVVLVMGASGVSSAQANPLVEELSGLLRSHPQIQSAEKAVESARAQVNQAFSDYYPQVSATADIGREIIDSPARRRIQGQVWNQTRQVGTVSVTQNLFDGFETSSSVAQARLNVEVSERTLDGTRQAIMFTGIGAYIDVLRQRRLIELARSNERTIQRQLNLEDERVQRGSGIAVDVLQAKSRLQIAKERRVTFEGALEDAVSRYIQIFDHAPNLEVMTDPLPPLDLLPPELEEAVAVAMVENPAVGSSVATVEVAAEARRSARSDYYPEVDFVTAYNVENNRDAVTGTRRDWSFLLQFSWDIFNGFETDATVAEAAFDYRASQDNHDLVTRQVVERTRIAWQQLVTARERVELLENAVNIASEVFESRKRLREAGKETVINVLDAENEVINAQINFTAATYDALLAAYQVLQSMGRLDAANLGIAD